MFYYIVTLILSLSVALIPSHALSADQINYVGSSTVGQLMKDAAGVYKDATFNINTEPESDGGENAVAAGKADIGGVARKVKPEIISKGVKEYLIGKDAIGVWVNIKNPVKELSSEQLKGIFTGKINSWKEVGGSDTPINVYIVNPQSATRKVFQNIVLAGEDYGGKRIETIRPDPAILDKVASESTGRVNHGTKVANEAGESLDKIIGGVKETTSLVEMISSATEEQSAGADEVKKAIEELAKISEHNASATEELSATTGELAKAADELSGMADKLNHIVKQFKINASRIKGTKT